MFMAGKLLTWDLLSNWTWRSCLLHCSWNHLQDFSSLLWLLDLLLHHLALDPCSTTPGTASFSWNSSWTTAFTLQLKQTINTQ